ncbi:MAG: hypothetical protein P4L79_10275 [Legionella sp.]|uniref:hypothetical protein n=1 Tax=Legionella sp. TaxID=459 RepID=UPI002846FFFD|nr:hypothetical protein [Legionella sp.]
MFDAVDPVEVALNKLCKDIGNTLSTLYITAKVLKDNPELAARVAHDYTTLSNSYTTFIKTLNIAVDTTPSLNN